MKSSEKPVKILLFGMYGAVNVGDELICRSVVQSLSRHFSAVFPIIISSNLERSKTFNHIDGVEYIAGGKFHYTFWMNFFGYMACMKNADAVIIGGGGLFQDHYSWRLALSASFCALSGKLLGKQVFVIGVGAGPLNRPEVRQAVFTSLKDVDLICTRDQQSKDVLVNCGTSPDRVLVTADLVPSMLLKHERNFEQVSENSIAFVLREWPGLDKLSLSTLFALLVRRGYRVDLVCFEPQADAVFYNSIVCECDPKVVDQIKIVKPSSLEEALSAIRQSSCVVSMRYHGLVLALMYGKPVIPVEYEKKVANLAQELGLHDLLKQTSALGVDLLVEIESTISCWETRENFLRHRRPVVVSASEMNFFELKNRLNNKISVLPVGERVKKYFTPWITILFYAFKEEVKHLFLEVNGYLLKKCKSSTSSS